MDASSRKIFGVLFFSLFTSVTGVGIVVPLLPVYAHAMGAGGLAIGLIFGAFSISRTLFLPWFGRLSDRKGRKPFIVTGMLCYALVSFAFMATNSVPVLIGIRFLQGIASAMMMPVVQAYAGDLSPSGHEGLTMGMFNMSLFIGLSTGPIIGGVIKDQFSLDAAFGAMGLLSLAGLVLSLFWLPPTISEKTVQRSNPPVAWRQLIQTGNLTGIFVFRLAYACCIGIIWSFLPVLADVHYGLSGTAIGVLVTLGVLSSGLLHLPMGALADRMNKTALVAVGGIISSAAIISIPWVAGINGLIAANLLFGVGGGIAMPAIMALAVIKGQQSRAMGSVISLVTMAHSLGMMIGAMMAGAMMTLFQLQQVFPLGGLLMIIAVGVFLLFGRAVPVKATPE